jgi:hypothetical protein
VYTPLVFSLTALQQVIVYCGVLAVCALLSRGNAGSVSIAAIWAALVWIGAVFYNSFAPAISLWAPFIMLPYFLAGYGFYLLVVIALERFFQSDLKEGSLIMLVIPMLYLPFAVIYFPARFLVFLWRSLLG